jgi:hypothetical protein
MKVLHRLRRQFEQEGRNRALLDAIDLCLRTSTKPPHWIAQPFCDRYTRWCLSRAKTLDEAFKVAPKKGERVANRIEREKWRLLVTAMYYKLKGHVSTGSKDSEANLFKLVNRRLGIKNAKGIFYHSDNRSTRKLIETLRKMPKGPPQK